MNLFCVVKTAAGLANSEIYCYEKSTSSQLEVRAIAPSVVDDVQLIQHKFLNKKVKMDMEIPTSLWTHGPRPGAFYDPPGGVKSTSTIPAKHTL